MRVAFFSPMPPSKSGIADYSAALLEHLRNMADVTVIDHPPLAFDPARFDIAVYQLGNNPYHGFVYRAALEHPGVAVMHESNLHHLVADLTIKRGDWDAYLREVEYEGGEPALAHAQRARALETGPDYEGVPMVRRLLERSRAVVVHSRFMESEIRKAGFGGPVGRIPHGAWIPQAERHVWRERLGLDETVPLIGIFGFLKPYKRISESLRAFRRLLRVHPAAKMILAGEPHPDLGLGSLLRTLDLGASVRVLGFTPIEDFTGYMAACDVVLNLRYPTVGESSGSLLRALGLGKAVLVSDVGSFSELPPDVCLKVPVDASEGEFLFEYLNLLVSRPEVARTFGARARRWVERECSWELAARGYVSFLESVLSGAPFEPPRPEPAPETTPGPPEETIREWVAPEAGPLAYAEDHMDRLRKTLAITPRGGPDDRILEMGAYLQITPALEEQLGYGEVRGCYYGRAGTVERRSVTTDAGRRFECDVDLFDAERDPFPYPSGHFATVLCCELIEHLAQDPMHMMAEINRILRPGGHLVLTTPNIASLRSLHALLMGYHPGFFPSYLRPAAEVEDEARHHREYAPEEVRKLLRDSGFETVLLETGPFREAPRPELAWVDHMLARYQVARDMRGDGIYAVGRKVSPVRERYPSWLYYGGPR